MRRKFDKFRAFFIALSAIISIAIGLSFTGDRPRAQVRKIPKREAPRATAKPADAVTAEIRRSSNDLVHVPVYSAADRDKISRLGTIVSDHGSFVIALGNESISADRFGEGAQKIDTTVHLPGAVFDPLESPPIETVQPGTISKYGPSYFVVQLGGIATDDVLDSVRASGFEVIHYVPHNAFIIYGEASEASRVAENSRVRWVGELTARQKITPSLLDAGAESKSRSAMYNIAVFSRANLSEVAGRIMSVSGGTPLAEMPLDNTFFNVVRVSMSPAQLEAVAAIPDVARIDSWVKPTRDDERAAQIVAGNFQSPNILFTPPYNPLGQFGYDGTGVTVAVGDDGVSIPGNGGFYISAANTANANLRGSTAGATSGHGHINASIIAGTTPFGVLDPLGFNYGLGIAPNAHILNIPLLKSGYTGTDANAASDAVTTNGPNGVPATISNNSWGAGTNLNAYDSSAATYDSLTRDATAAGNVDPLFFVFSAGNCGEGPNIPACTSQTGLARPHVAKNIISVGSSENLRSNFVGSSNNVEDISSFSSRGPAADGRIKPDIVAPGDAITGSRAGTSCTGVGECFDANHSWSSGTSHAAPQVAGVAALFWQYWKATHSGANPSVAMAKAAIIQTGQEMTGIGATNPVPNGTEGWGRVNMSSMLNTGVAMKHIDQTTVFLSPGDTLVIPGKIADGTKPFRATLVWTDPPGASDPALVNNLNLSVNIGGNNYLGNNFAGGLSALGGVADTRNNVEQVWRTGVAANTQVAVTITAAALNGDGVIGNGDATDQHFAVVLYNFIDAPLTNFGITGRAVSGAGRGVANVNMVLSNGGGYVASTFTNTFGYFAFPNIPGNQSYTLTPVSKRYRFDSQIVNLGSADMTGILFTSTAGAP